MKKVLFLMLFLTVLGAVNVHAQVKVGDNLPPKTGAVLDLKSSYVGGLLLPNVSIVDTATIDFTEATLWNVDSNHDLTGLIVYNTNDALPAGKGIYVWDGEKWLAVGIGGGGGGPVNPGCGELTIASQTPASTTINANAGDGVTLSVTASISDGTTPTFQWYQNSVAGTTGAAKINGTTSGNTSSLTVSTVAGTNLFYYCTITSPCDMTEILSNNWNIIVPPNSPGSTWLGYSNECTYNQKQNCTCAAGTPIFYDDTTPAQRLAAQALFNWQLNLHRWWASNSNSDQIAWDYLAASGVWTNMNRSSGTYSAACF